MYSYNDLTMDTVIEKAAAMSGVSFADLLKCLPQEFTLWIDPSDVSYRIGEDGSICCLFSSTAEEAPSQTTNNVSLTNQSCQSEVPKPMVIRSGSTFTKCLS
jgi:protein Tob/BTG